MMMIRLFSCVVAVAGASFTGMSGVAEAGERPVAISLEPLGFETRLLDEQKVDFVAALRLTTKDKAFGGFSGLLLRGGRLRAIGDRGLWLVATAERDAAGAVTALTAARLGDLRDEDGVALEGRARDAEALAEDANGRLWIAFEQRHRIRGYSSLDGPGPGRLEQQPVDALGRNAGLEGLARAADGAFWSLAEEPAPGETRQQGWRIEGAGARRFTYTRLDEFDATGADFGPDGALYVLERRYRPLTGVRMRIRRFSVGALAFVAPGEDGDLGDGELLLSLDQRAPIDNMEGLSVERRADGKLLLTAISDDNFNPLQRTVLLQFAVDPAR